MPPPIRSLVGEGRVASGELRSTDGLRVDGEVFGGAIAHAEGRSIVVISENGRVRGEVKAGHVMIGREAVIPVAAEEPFESQPRARIAGDVR